jgi:inorganic pyrophosphatase
MAGGPVADSIDVVIEIPQGSRNKYEYDHVSHAIRLDRVLHSSVHYPSDYGFIPDTLSEDGDPLDVLVLVYEPTFPGCIIPVRPIGVLRMNDDKGYDEKILAVPAGDPRFDDVFDLPDLHGHWLREIENFFATYKLLEEKNTELHGWKNAEAARQVIVHACERHTEALRSEVPR